MIDLADVSKKHVNKKIAIVSYICNFNNYGTIAFLDICDKTGGQNFKAIAFQMNNDFDYSRKYMFFGRITLHEGEIEMIIEKIDIIE